jgi:fumarate hydratase class II
MLVTSLKEHHPADKAAKIMKTTLHNGTTLAERGGRRRLCHQMRIDG